MHASLHIYIYVLYTYVYEINLTFFDGTKRTK